MPGRSRKLLVIGMGNTLLSDDGAGIYIARKLVPVPGTLDVIEASAGGLEILELMRGYDRVILIDSIMTGAEPGTLFRIKPEELDGGSAMSRHHVSLPEALALGRALKMDLPDEVTIYAVEVEDVTTFREACSPSVRDKIEDIAGQIQKEIAVFVDS